MADTEGRLALWYHVYGSLWTAKIIQTNNLIITREAVWCYGIIFTVLYEQQKYYYTHKIIINLINTREYQPVSRVARRRIMNRQLAIMSMLVTKTVFDLVIKMPKSAASVMILHGSENTKAHSPRMLSRDRMTNHTRKQGKIMLLIYVDLRFSSLPSWMTPKLKCVQ